MNIDIDWDDAAYILALMEHAGVRNEPLRGQLIRAMRAYDGQTSTRAVMTRDIKFRVKHWKDLFD